MPRPAGSAAMWSFRIRAAVVTTACPVVCRRVRAAVMVAGRQTAVPARVPVTVAAGGGIAMSAGRGTVVPARTRTAAVIAGGTVAVPSG